MTPTAAKRRVDEPTGKPTKPRAFYDEWAAKQDAHIADKDMVPVGGYTGPDPDRRTGSRLYIERTQANIPGMQQLFFLPDEDYVPEFTVIYTPMLLTPEFGEDCLILVVLDNWVTRVFGSDYFGESRWVACGCGTRWSMTAVVWPRTWGQDLPGRPDPARHGSVSHGLPFESAALLSRRIPEETAA